MVLKFPVVWLVAAVLTGFLQKGVRAASSMLAGTTGTTVSMNPGYGGGMFGGNASVSVDSYNGMSRIHGSGLHLNVDLLEILTEKGIFRISPTHTEFQQTQSSSSWAQLYSNEEMTIYYDNAAVVQLAGGSTDGESSITVNGAGYFSDLYFDKQKTNLLGVALCRVHTSLKGGKCDSANFNSVQGILGAIVQDLIAIAEQLKNVAASGASGSSSNKNNANNDNNDNNNVGAGIDEKQLHAHLKLALSQFEDRIAESRPIKEAFQRQEEQVKKISKDTDKKAEDLAIKMQSGVAELSKDADAAKADMVSLIERVQRVEAEGGTALRDDIERVRGTMKEMDATFSTSLDDLRRRSEKNHEALAKIVTEAGASTTTNLQALREDARTELTSAKEDFSEALGILGKDVAAAATSYTALEKNIQLVNTSINVLAASNFAYTEDVTALNISLHDKLISANSVLQGSVDEIHTNLSHVSSRLETHVKDLSQGISDVSNNISTAVARGNGILSKVIGEMNVTVISSQGRIGGVEEKIARVETEGRAALHTLQDDMEARLKESEMKSNVTVTKLIASLEALDGATKEGVAETELLERRLQSVNATSMDSLQLAEGRLLQGLDEVSREVSLVEKSIRDTLARYTEEIEAEAMRVNVTTTAALETALSRVQGEISAVQASVSAQLADLTKTMTSLSESSSVAREVLSERLTALTARVTKEEEESTRATEISAQNREKISKMESQLSQCESRQKEANEDASKVRDRLTKMETLVEMLMKK